QQDPYLRAEVAAIDETEPDDSSEASAELTGRVRSIKELAIQIVNMSPNLPSEAAYAIQNIESPGFLIHFIASNLQIDVAQKQALLETRPLLDRASLVLTHLEQEIRVLQISEEIRSKVKTDVDQQQREFLLRQQMKAIQEELGESEGGAAEAEELRERMEEKAAFLPDYVEETLEKELTKLARTNPASPEYGVTRSYTTTTRRRWTSNSPRRTGPGQAAARTVSPGTTWGASSSSPVAAHPSTTSASRAPGRSATRTTSGSRTRRSGFASTSASSG